VTKSIKAGFGSCWLRIGKAAFGQLDAFGQAKFAARLEARLRAFPMDV
jgi:hypothetical protein